MQIIAYYRVSTKAQGHSGLGLAGQREAVKAYAAQTSAQIIKSYTEVESGKRHENRPQLALALASAKALKATLVVAKLDRLARNVAFLSALMESGAQFVACDMPAANKLTLHILAAVAENELESISNRLKAAFKEKRKRGEPMGGANPKCNRFKPADGLKGSAAARMVNWNKAREFRTAMRPIARQLRDEGKSNLEIAAELNGAGFRTRRGKLWTICTVADLLNQMFERPKPQGENV